MGSCAQISSPEQLQGSFLKAAHELVDVMEVGTIGYTRVLFVDM